MNSLNSNNKKVLLKDIVTKMTKEKFDKVVETIFKYEDIYSQKNNKKNCMTLISAYGLTNDEAIFLIHHARGNKKVAEDIQATGIVAFVIGVIFILAGVVLIYLSTKIGYIIRLFVILPLFGMAGISQGILYVLIANFSIFRRKWADNLMPIIFSGLIITGLAGVIYYLAFM